MTHWTFARVCVPTYMRNTYPGVGSVLRAIIACRPEDSLRPVLSYPSSSLAIVPRQTHDHNPSFPFRLPDSLSHSGPREPLSLLSLSKGNLLVGFFSSSAFLPSLTGNTCLSEEQHYNLVYKSIL